MAALLLVLMPCLGLGASAAYLRAWNRGMLSRWRRLEPLPAQGVEFVSGTITSVHVRALDGRVYGCRHRGGVQVPKECWYEVNEPLPEPRDTQPRGRLYQGQVQPPAGTVVDQLEVTAWYAESASEVRYVLMQDGSVLKWEYNQGMFGSLAKLAVGPIVGLGLGVALVAILGLYRARQRRSEPGPAGEPEG